MNWLEGSTAQALANTLLHFLWQGAMIALILGIALRLARDSSRVRYGLAAAAMFAMPLVFVATFVVLLPDGTDRLVAAVDTTAAPNSRAVPVSLPAAPSVETIKNTLPWIVPIWIAGVLACYLRSLIGCMAVERLRRTGVCNPPREWSDRTRQLATRLRISRPVLLLESALAEVPVVIGFLRPVVLIPAGLLAGLAPAQIEAILIHELAHIRRWDYLVNLAQGIVEGLLFYHPAVWWIGRTMRAERENCCDDTVVAIAGDPHGYATALATLETIRCASREPALAATGGDLMKRIRRILQQPEMGSPVGPALHSGILLVMAAAILAAWPIAAPEPAPTPQAQLPPPPVRKTGGDRAPLAPPSSPYRQWLLQDVAYIITDAERAQFRGLATAQELERFIELFWLRRDPTSATPENEFQEEHYRRIAYANERFASAIAGWKTDRGRIYITYGPPDVVESHPSGDPPNGYPYEIWRYRYLEGIGEHIIVRFDDANRNGEYRLQTDPRQLVR